MAQVQPTLTQPSVSQRIHSYLPEKIEWKTNPKWMYDDSQKWYTDGPKTPYGVGAGVGAQNPQIIHSHQGHHHLPSGIIRNMEAANIMPT